MCAKKISYIVIGQDSQNKMVTIIKKFQQKVTRQAEKLSRQQTLKNKSNFDYQEKILRYRYI